MRVKYLNMRVKNKNTTSQTQNEGKNNNSKYYIINNFTKVITLKDLKI